MDAQVIIIGGGVMGTSLLYHLAKAGWSDLLLLEKNDLTHGSTWHAAGLCTHFAHNPTIQELRATSVRLYRDTLPDEVGHAVGFHSSGAMRITRNPDRMDEFRHVAGLSSFTGYPLEVLTPDRIAELHPLTRLDGLLGGIYEPDDGHVDPTQATNAMARVAQQNGATIRRYTPVRSITRVGGLWRVETDEAQFTAKHIVNAAGTWGWEVGRMMGLDIPSVPVLHQYLVTDTIPEVTARLEKGAAELPMIRDPEESWYVRQERDGLILGPYERDAHVWSVDGVPADFGADLLPPDLDRVEDIVQAAMDRIPALGNGGIKSVVNGPITFTPDANPLIGPAHGLENAWLLTGSSMGVMEGGGSGWFLAHWMTHGAPPMDALPVDSRRFGRWADRDYRVTKAVECFGLQFGVHYPYEERLAARNVRTSPLHTLMLERGAVMGAAYGWERPNWFSEKPGARAQHSFRRTDWFDAVAREVDAVSNRVALADLSVFSKFEVKGPGTQAFLEMLGTNRPPATGRVGLNYLLTPAGGILAEFTIARLSDDFAYLTSAAAAEELNLDLLHHHAASFEVSVSNVTETIAVIGVMGPLSRDLLMQLQPTGPTVSQPWLSVTESELAGYSVRALRVSYVGELGWELHVPSRHAAALYLLLEEAGKNQGVGTYGAFAADSMRLEKGYRGWGGDLTSERTPSESGVERFVDVENRTFAGRDAMIERDQRSDRWTMVLLDMETDSIDPFFSHPVFDGDEVIGVVTSGRYGFRTNKSLGLAYLRRKPTGTLGVEILGVRHRTSILAEPPFDPTNERLKA